MTEPDAVHRELRRQAAMGLFEFDEAPARPRQQVTSEVCVQHGGHCWYRADQMAASFPPIYTEFCRHCPASRRGRPQESIAWTYPEGQA